MPTQPAFKPNGIIALLTDFGVRDPFVGVMKGVILANFPHARIVDLTHEIEPQDVQAGAFALQGAWRYFSEGTVFVAVVDPGVGSTRQMVYGVRESRLFIGPDNGILSYVLRADDPTWKLHVDKFSLPERSSTFHGRDIFAPAAAKLAQGYPPEFAGDPLERLRNLDRPKPKLDKDGSLLGEVVSVDRFGNLITTIAREDLRAFAGGTPGILNITIGKQAVGKLLNTYSDGKPGEPLALVNSLGHLEIAVRDGSAAQVLGITRGAEVRARRLAGR